MTHTQAISSFDDEQSPDIRYDDWGAWDYNDYDLCPLEEDNDD